MSVSLSKRDLVCITEVSIEESKTVNQIEIMMTFYCAFEVIVLFFSLGPLQFRFLNRLVLPPLFIVSEAFCCLYLVL